MRVGRIVEGGGYVRRAIGGKRSLIGVRVGRAAVDSPRQGHRRVVDRTLWLLVLLLLLVGVGRVPEVCLL